MLPSEARELKQLREENARLKRVVADFDLGQGHAPGRRAKKVLKPLKQREVVHYVMGRYQVRAASRPGCPVLSLEHPLRELS